MERHHCQRCPSKLQNLSFAAVFKSATVEYLAYLKYHIDRKRHYISPLLDFVAERHRAFSETCNDAVLESQVKPKVLIVADDLETALSLHAALNLAGYEVAATEAVSIAENPNPDVVIVDESSLKDPSCTNWLKQHLALPAILLLSPEKQNLVSNFPSSAFLIKPVHSLQLIHSVYASLHRERGG